MSSDAAADLGVSATKHAEATVLTVRGTLDTTTYLTLRDTIIKAALDEPSAVLVDISALYIPAESAMAVFTSARWHVQRWPETPIVLVCAHAIGRQAAARNGVARFVPVYPKVSAALSALSRSGGEPHGRRRVVSELPSGPVCVQRSRELVTEWLAAWSLSEMIPVVKVIATALVENVVAHTDGGAALRLETNGSEVTVAVLDTSSDRPGPRERCPKVTTGLQIVAALCRAWGTAPIGGGKTVWAVVGPENRL